MVEVFKTNVKQKKEVRPLLRALSQSFPQHRINFDLEDCDRILRIEGESIGIKKVINTLHDQGFKCTILR